MSSGEKFQALLRELFQFDCADLDFGIYRIMNYKRQVIEKWIAEDLPCAISDELKHGALAEQGQAQEALQAACRKVLDALDADGNLAEAYRATKAGREYLEAQAKAQGTCPAEALETATYNHLYTLLLPLLAGRRLYLQTPLLQEGTLRHPLPTESGRTPQRLRE